MPERTKPAIWGAIGGAVAITIVGFSADWVMTTGSATAMANDNAEMEVLSALAPICVTQSAPRPLKFARSGLRQ